MKSLLSKFKYAFRGLLSCVSDRSVTLQFAIAFIVLIIAYFFRFSLIEWCILLLCCGLVIICEMVNSCFELLLDFIHPDYHNKIKVMKDKGAGFVLFASIVAFIIGVLLFGSKLL